MAAIAERIGVTVPAITHHFGTKNALFTAVVAVTDSLDEIRMSRSPDDCGLNRVSALRVWARELTSDSSLANLSRLTVVMTAEALDDDFPAHAHFVNRHRRFRQRLGESIKSGQSDGSIRGDVDAATTACEVLSFIQGASLHWFLDPEQIDLVRIYDSYFDRLVSDLRAVPAPGETARSRNRRALRSGRA